MVQKKQLLARVSDKKEILRITVALVVVKVQRVVGEYSARYFPPRRAQSLVCIVKFTY